MARAQAYHHRSAPVGRLGLALALLLAVALALGHGNGALAADNVLDQQQTSWDGGSHTVITGSQSRAQTFTAGMTGYLDRVSLNLLRNSVFGSPGDLTVAIYATSGGLPTGAALVTTTISQDRVVSYPSYSWVDVYFESPPLVTSGAQYAIVLTIGSSVGDYRWATAGDVYLGGRGAVADGSGWYFPSKSVDANFKTYVVPTVQEQTISFGPLADKTYGDPSFTVSAIASSDLPVSFSAAPSSVCTASGTDGSTVTIVGVGTCTVTAAQAGNPSYHPASNVQRSFTVNPTPLTITANDQTMVLHGPLPTFTASYAGFANGDTAGVVTGLSCTARDPNGNPVSSSTPVGSYPITCSGASAANYAPTYTAGTLAVIYAPAGTSCLGEPGHAILQPVNADGSSVFKAGSTVPLRFRVCDADGVSIGTPGVVHAFALVKASADPNAAVNEPPTSSMPDTAFRWDATSQQWRFNLSTRGLTSGTKYAYVITLNDGTTIAFSFALR